MANSNSSEPNRQTTETSVQPMNTECQFKSKGGIKQDLDSASNGFVCTQKEAGAFNYQLPQRNSGIKKYEIKNSRIKNTMLGNLTFREIAEKRKDMIKSSPVLNTENYVPNSNVATASNGLQSNKEEEDCPKNGKTYINPHTLIGKTLELQQGEMRIKFLTQDSTTSSNKKLLKLDALQLTSKIIIKKCKPGLLPSNQTQINIEDLRNSLDQYQKISQQSINMHSTINYDGLKFPPRSSSMPHHLSMTHNQISLDTECSNNFSNVNVVDARAVDGNLTDESLLVSSCDGLNLLSGVACQIKDEMQELEINRKTYVNGKPSREYSMQPKQTVNVNNLAAKSSLRDIFSCQKTEDEYINKCLQNGNSGETPMFAWCTQYVTQSRLHKKSVSKCSSTNDKIPVNKKPLFEGRKEVVTKFPNSHHSTKKQCRQENKDSTYRTMNGNLKPSNSFSSSNSDTSQKIVNTALCGKIENHKSPTDIVVKKSISSEKEKGFCETNDEVTIVKEILVTKPHYNSFCDKNSVFSKQKINNSMPISTTESQKIVYKSDKNVLKRRVFNGATGNKLRSTGDIHKSSKKSLKVSEPSLKDEKSVWKTLSSLINNDQDVTKKLPDVLTATVTRDSTSSIKHEDSCDYPLKFNSACESKSVTEDSVRKARCSIKKCFVLIEKLPLSISTPLGKGTRIGSSSSPTKSVNNLGSDFVSPSSYSKENGVSSRLSQTCNSDFTKTEQSYNHPSHHQVISTPIAILAINTNKVPNTKNGISKGILPHAVFRKIDKTHDSISSEGNLTFSKEPGTHSECQINERFLIECFQENEKGKISVGYYKNNNNQTDLLSQNTCQIKSKWKLSDSEEDLPTCIERKEDKKRGRLKRLSAKNLIGLEAQKIADEEAETIANIKKFVQKFNDKRYADVKQGSEPSELNDVKVLRSKSKIEARLSTEKCFDTSREMCSLLTDSTTLGCSIKANRKRRKSDDTPQPLVKSSKTESYSNEYNNNEKNPIAILELETSPTSQCDSSLNINKNKQDHANISRIKFKVKRSNTRSSKSGNPITPNISCKKVEEKLPNTRSYETRNAIKLHNKTRRKNTVQTTKLENKSSGPNKKFKELTCRDSNPISNRRNVKRRNFRATKESKNNRISTVKGKKPHLTEQKRLKPQTSRPLNSDPNNSLTKSPNFSRDTFFCNNLTKSNLVKGFVPTEESSKHVEVTNNCETPCLRFKNQSQKKSQTNHQEPYTDVQPTNGNTRRQGIENKGEPKNSQEIHSSNTRDKIRSIVMEQLMRSRRKIANKMLSFNR